MKTRRAARKLVDRVALHPTESVPVFFAFSPLLAYIVAIEAGWASRSNWVLGLVLAASAALGGVVVCRMLKFGNRFLRPEIRHGIDGLVGISRANTANTRWAHRSAAARACATLR